MHRRQLLLAGLTLPLVVMATEESEAAAPFDAFVSHSGSRTDTPTWPTVSAAIAAAPASTSRPFRILVDVGIWHEKLVIDKPHVHLFGARGHASILRFDAAAGQRGPDGEPWGTWGCASLRVTAPGFSAHDLVIENTFDYLGHLRDPKLETTGANGPQAVALMLDVGSDNAMIERCTIRGHQDTLFVEAGRSQFRDCTISGSVDFIFGAGEAFFESCTLVSRHRPGKTREGYVCAPSTPRLQQRGLVFLRCRLEREPEVADGSVALGRAWRPTRTFADGRYGDPDALGAAALIDCAMDAHIAEEGWDAMNYTTRDGSRTALQPGEARLAEYANHGPGARLHRARPQLSAQQAAALLQAIAS